MSTATATVTGNVDELKNNLVEAQRKERMLLGAIASANNAEKEAQSEASKTAIKADRKTYEEDLTKVQDEIASLKEAIKPTSAPHDAPPVPPTKDNPNDIMIVLEKLEKIDGHLKTIEAKEPPKVPQAKGMDGSSSSELLKELGHRAWTYLMSSGTKKENKQ